MLFTATSSTFAFWGDNATLPDGPHSSFHYEFTRTLARAAGFSRDEAELISVVAQATDRLAFQDTGLDSPFVQMWGTERVLEPDYCFCSLHPDQGDHNLLKSELPMRNI